MYNDNIYLFVYVLHSWVMNVKKTRQMSRMETNQIPKINKMKIYAFGININPVKKMEVFSTIINLNSI